MRYFVLDMKYMCKSCKTTCSNIIEHLKKVHGFSESYIKNQLKTSTNSYLHAFEEIKWLRKNHMDIILVERLNRKDVKRINQNEFSALLTRKFSGLHTSKKSKRCSYLCIISIYLTWKFLKERFSCGLKVQDL